MIEVTAGATGVEVVTIDVMTEVMIVVGHLAAEMGQGRLTTRTWVRV
jgi:hypothetical protein